MLLLHWSHLGEPGGAEAGASFRLCGGERHTYSLGLFHTALDVTKLLPAMQQQQQLRHSGHWPESSIAAADQLASGDAPADALALSDPGVSWSDLPDPVPSPEWFLEPALAAGLLLLSHACEAAGLRDHRRQQHQDRRRSSGPAVSAASGHRLNWRLLHDYPSEAQGAALWSGLGDWRKAAVLAFTVHQMGSASPWGGGGARGGQAAAVPGRPSLPTPLQPPLLMQPAELLTQLDAGLMVLDGSSRDAGGTAGTVDTEAAEAVVASRRSESSGDGRSKGGGCLRVGLLILMQQVARCHGMEVQEACITLHELVAIPRHVLGQRSAVYGLMLRKVRALTWYGSTRGLSGPNLSATKGEGPDLGTGQPI